MELIIDVLFFTAWVVIFIQDIKLYLLEKTTTHKIWIALSGFLAIESFLDIIEHI